LHPVTYRGVGVGGVGHDATQRSNRKSTFSAISRKFGDSVRAKCDLSMNNETLAKFVCHNLCTLVQSMEEFGIDPSFGLPR